MTDIYDFLQSHDIAFEKCEHPAVFTCEESKVLVPPLPGAHTKNLFVKDKHGNLILVVTECGKSVDLKGLGAALNVKKFSFASAEQLKEFLGVEPGSVTVLGLMHDREGAVKVIVDADVWHAEAIQCHPLVNTATLVISHEGLEKFLEATKHEVIIINVPARNRVQ